ncbi:MULTISPECIES: PIN domain nuclease [unclassified Sphingomonas]|uniref:type II toxin-antitoxin system VapC family toxin n=1 Tax=unclassified Sphingomonas TaxID=196159 RepID=UPI00226AF66F|nr:MULTISPECIES: PIN domain nuclease [unclassified Sphingomonas]
MGLILVDSSVWIDLLLDRPTLQTDALTRCLDAGQALAIGDLILMEVLQGARHARQVSEALLLFRHMTLIVISDLAVARQAAHHYRDLRSRGITIRKTIDTLIATRCILDGLPLLYSDRDFDPFVEHLGLFSAMNLLPE